MKNSTILFVLIFCFIRCQPAKEDGKEKEVTQQLFQKVASDSSGVGFKNILLENDLINFYTWKYIYNGGGVAVGDINNDGLPELYFSSNMFGNRLYLNLGNMKFQDITKEAGVEAASGYKTGVTMIDINQDGLLDIYVCRTALPDSQLRNNLLYINNGDNTFTEKAKDFNLLDEGFSTQGYFLDFDNDNDLDLYLINTPVDFDYAIDLHLTRTEEGLQRNGKPRSRYTSDQLFINNGRGLFQEQSASLGVSNHAFGLSAAIIDVNDDGFSDIFVGNDFVDPDFLYLNNKGTGFVDQIDKFFYRTSQNSMGSDVGDINNDGLEDLIVLDMLPEPHYRKKLLATSMVSDRYESLLKYGYGPQLMRNVLQINAGGGAFTEAAYFAGLAETDWSWSVLLEDVDADGWKDVVITNGIKRDMTNMDYVNFKMDSMEKAEKVGQEAITPQNFKKWINIMPSIPVSNYLFKNKGNAQFDNLTKAWGFDYPGFSNGLAIADLDADGDLDIVINNIDDFAGIYENTLNEAAKYLKVKFKGPQGNLNGIGAKVNIFRKGLVQSATLQNSRGFLSSSPHELYFGLGKDDMIDSMQVFWPDQRKETVYEVQAQQLFTFNYEQSIITNSPTPPDQKKTFFTKSDLIKFKHQEDELNDFKLQPLMPFKHSMEGPALATAKNEETGLNLIYLGGASGQAGNLFLVDKTGKVVTRSVEVFEKDKFAEDTDALFLDYDQDGDLDLYVVSGGNSYPANHTTYQDRLYQNDGLNNFIKTSNILPEIKSSGSCVSAGDLNRDGFPDLFIGSKTKPGEFPESADNYILINEKGAFKLWLKDKSKDLAQVGMVTDAVWNDFNSDGFDDLLLVGHFMPITIFLNQSGQALQALENSESLKNTAGLWNRIYEADVNNDGLPEYILGNFGLNTLFKNPKNVPIKILNNDFDNNGKKEGIIVFQENNTWYPIARKEILAKVLPLINKKFNSYEAYAKASIEELLPADKLSSAKEYPLQMLESSILSLNGHLDFQLTALPYPLQLAPIYAIESTDVDGDSIKDFIFAGNFSSTEVEHGPYNGGKGYVLKGNNTFAPQLIGFSETGFLMDKEARNMALININGKNHLIIANNNDSVATFILPENNSPAPLTINQ